jgi:hypothetical protein
LSFDRLRCAAARECVIVQTAIYGFRIEFEYRSQAGPTSPVHLIHGFTQNELAAVRGVPDIEYVCHGAPSVRTVSDYGAGRSRIHTADHHVNSVERFLAAQVLRQGFPTQVPEEIQPVHQHDGLVMAAFEATERLSDAVGGRNHVSVHDRYVQATGMAPCQQRLME